MPARLLSLCCNSAARASHTQPWALPESAAAWKWTTAAAKAEEGKERMVVPAVDEDDEEGDSEGEMTWACEVAIMRLVEKCRKETLSVGISGDKERLTEDAAEQRHYETDDEESSVDDDNDDDDDDDDEWAVNCHR